MFLSNDINEHVEKGLDEKVLIAKAISEWLMWVCANLSERQGRWLYPWITYGSDHTLTNVTGWLSINN